LELALACFAQQAYFDRLEWSPLPHHFTRIFSGFWLLAVVTQASPDVVRRASALYQSTDYKTSLHILSEDPAPDAENYFLGGRNYFMLGDYKKG
jgi:hypothetical protein